jgi:hypothetical protein
VYHQADGDGSARTGGTPLGSPATEGIDLFKIANRSISGWVPSFKLSSAAAPVKLPFCSQLEERLLLWLEYHPLVVSYARGDIGPQFAAAYRLPIPKHAPFAIGYAFEGKPHEYLPDVVGRLSDGTPFIAEAGMEDDKRSDRNRGLCRGCSPFVTHSTRHLLDWNGASPFQTPSLQPRLLACQAQALSCL